MSCMSGLEPFKLPASTPLLVRAKIEVETFTCSAYFAEQLELSTPVLWTKVTLLEMK